METTVLECLPKKRKVMGLSLTKAIGDVRMSIQS